MSNSNLRRLVFMCGVGATGKTTFIKTLAESVPNACVWEASNTHSVPEGALLIVPSQSRQYYKRLALQYAQDGEEITEKYINALPLDQQIRFQEQLYSMYMSDLLLFLETFVHSQKQVPVMLMERSPYDHLSYLRARVLQICRETRQAVPSSYEQSYQSDLRDAHSILSKEWFSKRGIEVSLAYAPYPAPWSSSVDDREAHADDGFRDTSSKKNAEWCNELLKCLEQFSGGSIHHLDLTRPQDAISLIMREDHGNY